MVQYLDDFMDKQKLIATEGGPANCVKGRGADDELFYLFDIILSLFAPDQK